MKKKNGYINVIVQGYYGNKNLMSVKNEDIDKLLMGFPSEPTAFKKNQTVVRISGTDNLAIVYNKYREERKMEGAKRKGIKYHALASIPGLDIHCICFVCRIDDNGNYASIKAEDFPKFMDYLAD